MPNVFLYAPQDFRNLCVVARTLEVLGHAACHVYDPHRLVRERYGKARLRTMRDVSAGAFEKIAWQRVDDPAAFLAAYPGRVVATVADAGAGTWHGHPAHAREAPTPGAAPAEHGLEARATPLSSFHFAPGDLIVFGPESQGLPPEVVAAAHAAVTIPARGATQSLNLAVALAIVLWEAQRQEAHRQEAHLQLDGAGE